MLITNICPECGKAVSGAEAEWFEKYAETGEWHRTGDVVSDMRAVVIAAFHPDCAKRVTKPLHLPPK
jgi:hypothetical protein